ncbi:jg9165 [Pararge aegeria aegeria]|uniref:Jg9165 protein n=1 Tax=Pararge aegeria aegeria TaxID=348720 RepID=A0A8S4SBZ3_9NEOP|nr:jg9165 [Pararge aegeria aegeria]
MVRAHVRMTLEVGDLVFAGEDPVQRLIVCSDCIVSKNLIVRVVKDMFRPPLVESGWLIKFATPLATNLVLVRLIDTRQVTDKTDAAVT